ncbi:right-handed parallel beta-helix repeat-containing protein [Flavivirga eckloniae]|uniref:Uncharacterized protein n=1 Tax=Flavivirga eckloniae TaxID=1803846 RepID=A0A2K9PTV7_9FLAO|nr:right-handed parallel beta-helix repeat-containing protein [Flavivirga eckloniae]AUP80500.1 hypothetical protein C1H87_17995 [Flavivirga eckloniae]
MKFKPRFLLFACSAVLVLLIFSCEKQDPLFLYVSTTGLDTNIGSEAEPFLTIEKALAESRKSNGEKNIVVKEGSYFNVNLELGRSDSNLTLRAEGDKKPILYGGQKITNFKAEGDFVYADVAGTRHREWDFRVVEVNGEIRERARFPEKGAFTHLNEFDVRWLSSEAGGWERKPTQLEKTTLKYNPEDLSETLDVNNAELTIYHEWDETLVGLKGHDVANNILHFDNESQHPPGAFAKRNPNAQTYVVWNTVEGMTKPGSWYLDRTRERLYYWPKEGESISELEIVVPRFQNIIKFNNGIKNVTISGFTLASTTTKLVTGGYAALKFEGAISGKDIRNISLENLTIKNVGGWGVKFSGKDVSINGCDIKNCGAGAISYRGKNVKINNNKLHDIGLVYSSAVGIIGNGDSNTISHNEIYNMPYCGINGIGSNSLVEGNIIHNIKTFMQDGGAIYMFGHKNTVVRNNVVLSKPDSGIKVYAYYLDEGCKNCVVEHNVSYNAMVPVQAHMTKACRYENNIFIDEGDQVIAYANSSDLSFKKNILIANSIDFKGPDKSSPDFVKKESNRVMKSYSSAIGITSWENNIFYSVSDTINLNQLAQYELVKKKPLKALDGTVFESPELQGVMEGNFSSSNKALITSKDIHLQSFSSAGWNSDLPGLISIYYNPDFD